jgi:hypothetical protein
MSVDDAGANALDEVKAELVAREPIFHKPELGNTREDYLAQTADDFSEVGASGRVYERESLVESLVQRGDTPGQEHWLVSDAHCRELAFNTYALTYKLEQPELVSRRLTLWRRDPDGWKILYHQGTIVRQL